MEAYFPEAFTFFIVLVAIALFATERIPIEFSAIAILGVLLLFFEVFPLLDAQGENLLGASVLLQGFANPALIAVLALLVLGQGVIRTDALGWSTGYVLALARMNVTLSFALAFGCVLVLSPFLNNTPVVVLFIPILQVLAHRLRRTASRVMMPLSFVAVLAGMTTLIGSSTNLLVSGALTQLGEAPLGFFDMTVPGLVLVAVGLIYLIVFGPRLLPDRPSLPERLMTGRIPRFVAKLTVGSEAGLVDKPAASNVLGISNTRLILVQRGEQALLPPFTDVRLRSSDLLVVLATRTALTELAARYPGLLHNALAAETLGADDRDQGQFAAGDQVLAEVMIPPGSRLVGESLERIGFYRTYQCLVLGLERRSHMIRDQLTKIRLLAGDVLVVQGTRPQLQSLRRTGNLIPLDETVVELPAPQLAKRAAAIFVGVILLAATGLLPVVVSALLGCVAMIATGVLTFEQAARALDRRIVLLVPTSLALGAALERSGGAELLAQELLFGVQAFGAAVVLSLLFLIVALMTNILTNNATAIIFTPIAVSIAQSLGESPTVFALAVLLAANCSFATPIAYQTNLLIMGPGHYRFADFIRLGLPLVLLIWVAFSLFAPWYYQLGY
ncbi:SLC13 family permease [Pelagibius sp.]|uniref:SLC13 family permease n=1 Tax=Pelagibius sp. TaxID=1931238 RepID=UPI003B511075